MRTETLGKSYSNIDLAKFVFSFFVVAIHTNPLFNCQNAAVKNTFGIIFNIAVPFFFISSGYLLYEKTLFIKSKNEDDDETNITISVVKNHALKTLKLYIIWTIVYLPITIWNYVECKMSLTNAVIDFLRGLFLTGEHYNSWVLWYLLSSIYALIFIMILFRIKVKLRSIVLLGFSLFLIGVFISPVPDNLALKTPLSFLKMIIDNTIGSGRLFGGMFFIPLGMIIREKQKPRIYAYPLIIIGLVVCFMGMIISRYISNIFIAVLSTGVFIFVVNTPLKFSKVYYLLRKTSTTIYLIHLLIYSAFEVFIWGGREEVWIFGLCYYKHPFCRHWHYRQFGKNSKEKIDGQTQILLSQSVFQNQFSKGDGSIY